MGSSLTKMAVLAGNIGVPGDASTSPAPAEPDWRSDVGHGIKDSSVCRNGHPRTPETTAFRKGSPNCLICEGLARVRSKAKIGAQSCTIDRCELPVFSRGWCQKHYNRWTRNGDPTLTVNPRQDMTWLERFFDQVEITETCWLWRGPVDSRNGYGVFGRSQDGGSPHRFAYVTFVGPIADGLQVDHTCHNLDLSCRGLGGACPHRRCCNPDHLEAVTASVNMQRIYADRTHCKHGHEFTPENTRVRFHSGHGKIVSDCLTCAREQNRRAKAKARAVA